MKRVLKWSVPVDDRAHEVGAGQVVLVACQTGAVDEVQVWTEEFGDGLTRLARAFGTGQPMPEDAGHLGSVVVPVHPPKTLVWHIYEVHE